MAKYISEDLVASFKGTNISGNARALEVDESVTEIDVTTYGSADAEYLVTKKNQRTARMTILDDAGSTIVEELFAPGSSGTLEYSPEGTAAGKRKRTVIANVLKSTKTYPHDDAAQFSVDWRLSGSITKGTWA